MKLYTAVNFMALDSSQVNEWGQGNNNIDLFLKAVVKVQKDQGPSEYLELYVILDFS